MDLLKRCDETLTVRYRVYQNYYDPNVYGDDIADANDTVLLYSPTQRSGSLSFMVRLRDRRQRLSDL